MPLLDVTGLHVRYGAVDAVRGIDLKVEEGELVALLGANGVGKSSTLNAIIGLVPVADGAVRFRDEDVSRVPTELLVRRGLTLTPEGRRIFAGLTVEENLSLGAYGRRDAKAVSSSYERMYGLFPVLTERRQQLAGTLSGGEQQMLAIARSLMSEPQLLLLDEPSLGLAPQIVETIFDLIGALEGGRHHHPSGRTERRHVARPGRPGLCHDRRRDHRVRLRGRAQIVEPGRTGLSRGALRAVTIELFLQQTVNAVSLGGTYALLALGLAIVFSIMGMINFAHGELMTISGYTLFYCGLAGVPFIVSVPLAILVAMLAAMAMERIAFRPVRNSSPATMLVTSFAVAIILQTLFQNLISTRSQPVLLPDVLAESIAIGDFLIGVNKLLAIGATIVMLLFLNWFLKRTAVGVAMRAAAEDFPVARLMGVRANAVISGAFALSGLLAGVAAVLWVSQRASVDPLMGFVPVLKAFIASILGGLGSLTGAVAGGFLLGFIEIYLTAFLPEALQEFKEPIGLGIVVLVSCCGGRTG